MEEQVRKVFLDELPRYKEGRCEGKINWQECKQYSIFFIYEDISDYIIIISYIKNKQMLIVSYKDEEYKIATSSFITCKLGNILGKKTSKFKYEIGTRFQDEKRDITIINKKKIKDKSGIERKYYKYKCNKCNFSSGKHWNIYKEQYIEDFWVQESHLTDKKGCACCAGKIVVEGINDIPTTTPWMVKYFQGGYDEAKLYTKSSNKSIYPICPDCERIKEKSIIISTIYEREAINCVCSDNNRYPNKFAHNLLEQLNTDFITEHAPEWCKYTCKKESKQGIYDFYFNLNNKEYILEMDGGFHTKDNKMSGQTKEESQFIDNEKDRLANEHGIEVIRIDCCYDSVENRFEYIKNSILNNKKLNELFDLSRVDWNKCNEFALSNLVKQACEYKKNNPNMTSTEIGVLMKKAFCTIINWLKIGNELGWCHYDAKEETKKSIKSTNWNKKEVEIFKDNISLGTFESATELERRSEELFGVKLLQGKISAVYLGKKPQYKGYTFKLT